jgi:cytochrome P450
MFDFLKGFVLIGVCMSNPPLDTIVKWLGGMLFAKQEAVHRGFVRERVAERLQMKDLRPDLYAPTQHKPIRIKLMKWSITYAQSHLTTPAGMSIEELEETCVALTLAGSETTASLLSGVIYHLLKNPPVFQRLVKEIRTTFPTEDNINMTSVTSLKYELAVLEEGLRVFPPGR